MKAHGMRIFSMTIGAKKTMVVVVVVVGYLTMKKCGRF